MVLFDIPPIGTIERHIHDIKEIEALARGVLEVHAPLDRILCESFEKLVDMAGTREFIKGAATLGHYTRYVRMMREDTFNLGYIAPWILVQQIGKNPDKKNSAGARAFLSSIGSGDDIPPNFQDIEFDTREVYKMKLHREGFKLDDDPACVFPNSMCPTSSPHLSSYEQLPYYFNTYGKCTKAVGVYVKFVASGQISEACIQAEENRLRKEKSEREAAENKEREEREAAERLEEEKARRAAAEKAAAEKLAAQRAAEKEAADKRAAQRAAEKKAQKAAELAAAAEHAAATPRKGILKKTSTSFETVNEKVSASSGSPAWEPVKPYGCARTVKGVRFFSSASPPLSRNNRHKKSGGSSSAAAPDPAPIVHEIKKVTNWAQAAREIGVAVPEPRTSPGEKKPTAQIPDPYRTARNRVASGSIQTAASPTRAPTTTASTPSPSRRGRQSASSSSSAASPSPVPGKRTLSNPYANAAAARGHQSQQPISNAHNTVHQPQQQQQRSPHMSFSSAAPPSSIAYMLPRSPVGVFPVPMSPGYSTMSVYPTTSYYPVGYYPAPLVATSPAPLHGPFFATPYSIPMAPQQQHGTVTTSTPTSTAASPVRSRFPEPNFVFKVPYSKRKREIVEEEVEEEDHDTYSCVPSPPRPIARRNNKKAKSA
ncbi:hypothetical protein DFJ77DRAFT_221782 [Powellomyces hirtus]|nr:hypothetical protein DFJ77DRAFT_221782 [Powellomyces hirtus]